MDIEVIIVFVLVDFSALVFGHCPYEHNYSDMYERYWDRYFQYYNPNPQNPYSTRWHYLQPGFFSTPRMHGIDPAYYESPEGLRYQVIYNKCSDKNLDGSCKKRGPNVLTSFPKDLDPNVSPRRVQNFGSEFSQFSGEYVENQKAVPISPNMQISLLREFDQVPSSYGKQVFETLNRSKMVQPRTNMPSDRTLYANGFQPNGNGFNQITSAKQREYDRYYKEYQEYVNNYHRNTAQGININRNKKQPSTSALNPNRQSYSPNFQQQRQAPIMPYIYDQSRSQTFSFSRQATEPRNMVRYRGVR